MRFSDTRAVNELGAGRRIRAAREACGLSLEDFAYDVGIEVVRLVAIESGEPPLRGSEVERIADGLGRDPADLLAESFDPDGLPSRLLREARDAATRRAIRDQLAADRAIATLESLLGVGGGDADSSDPGACLMALARMAYRLEEISRSKFVEIERLVARIGVE